MAAADYSFPVQLVLVRRRGPGGHEPLGYPASIKIVRVPCSGRIDPMFILKSFERGADMVLVSGCHPGDCHYSSGNYHARRKLMAFRELVEFLGIDPRRFKFSWVSAAEGAKWSSLVKEITAEALELGPFEAFPSAARREEVKK